jgi:uncharacterized protein YsxB (DUF464 family)
MITADVTIADEMVTGFTISGHSGFSLKKNTDIVCAGVSSLIYGFMYAVQNLGGIVFDWKDQTDFSYHLKKLSENVEKYKGCSLYLLCGLKAISGSYRKNIKLNIKGE